MARMYPPRQIEQIQSPAERVLYRELRTQLSDDYHVLHSVSWIAGTGGRSRDGEADFLLAHPKHGLMILEVKGGIVRVDGATGEWTSENGRGEINRIKDPFAQSRRNMYALLELLAETPATAGTSYRTARAVVIPDMVIDPAVLPPDADRAAVIDSSDLATLGKALHRVWQAAPPGEPGQAGIAAVISTLRPTVTIGRPGLVGAMLAEQDALIQLTAEQVRMLDMLRGHRRIAIAGTAGSGKTLLALESVRRLANQGFRVLYTCFTKALAEWANAALQRDLGPSMTHVMAGNYHDIALRLVQSGGGLVPPDLQTADLHTFFHDVVPEMLLDTVDRIPARFDAIVVDEAQDFAGTWWLTLQALLADPQDGVLHIFYDDNQRIFDEPAREYPIPPPHLHLVRNCRTTRAIHTAAARYAPATALECDGPAGRPPVEIDVAPGDELAALRKVLTDLTVTEGVPLAEIIVLTPRSQQRSVLKHGDKLGTLSLSWTDEGPGLARIRTVQAFKGLEASVVILVEPDHMYAEKADAITHVALTRAKHHVIVLGRLPQASVR